MRKDEIDSQEIDVSVIDENAYRLQTICDRDNGSSATAGSLGPAGLFGGYAAVELIANVQGGPDLPGDALPFFVASLCGIAGIAAVIFAAEDETTRMRMLEKARRRMAMSSSSAPKVLLRAGRMLRRRQRTVYFKTAAAVLGVALVMQGAFCMTRAGSASAPNPTAVKQQSSLQVLQALPHG